MINNMKEINLDLTRKHYSYPSIGQYRNVIYNVNHNATYNGQDENGDPIYDSARPKPSLKFIFTEKQHGTNFSCILDYKNNVIYYQSRENIITPAKDNAGSASFIASIQEDFVNMIESTVDRRGYDIVAIYAEWCGKGIQSTVAISQVDKFAMILDVRLINDEKDRLWLPIEEVKKVKLHEHRIYNIHDHQTWEMEIDFNNPVLKQNDIIDLTMEIEKSSPTGKSFGIDGIGEGVVGKCITEGYNNDSGLWFKSKGELHSGKSKVKVLREVDNEKINKTIDVANQITPSWRLSQMLEKTYDLNNGGLLDRSKLGDFIRAVIADVVKEDLDIVLSNGLEMKDVNKYISDICRRYYFEEEKI